MTLDDISSTAGEELNSVQNRKNVKEFLCDPKHQIRANETQGFFFILLFTGVIDLDCSEAALCLILRYFMPVYNEIQCLAAHAFALGFNHRWGKFNPLLLIAVYVQCFLFVFGNNLSNYMLEGQQSADIYSRHREGPWFVFSWDWKKK